MALPIRSQLRLSALVGGAVLACMLHASDARADVSSWLSMGGGYGMERAASVDVYSRATIATFAIGVGSDPKNAVVFGGGLRTTTFFSLGTDLTLAPRIATGGFARGQWGVALDVGPSWRTWSGDYGRFPLRGMLFVGAPWGLQLGLGADMWNLAGDPPARGALAVLEIDLLRLTVMRQGRTDQWWENPSPAGGRISRE